MNISPMPRREYPTETVVYGLCWRWAAGLASFLSHARVHNLDHVPPAGPLLVAANHSSYLDPIYLGSAISRPTRYMAKDTLFRGPLGALISRLGAFPVRRGDADPGAIRTAMRSLKQGDVLIMFPEGTRGQGADMLDAQKGIGFLATRTGAAVLPAYLHGMAEVFGRARGWPRPGQVEIVFGEPRQYLRDDDPSEAAVEVVRDIKLLGSSIDSLKLDRARRVG
ncbi:1-acyl-sn-glycerol-3-phosphate acyltransferase [Candidatus Poribacteria bacterium]|jgi:1-acyl-sn-glycerol-3-phosphate acyltransferase|nr:1-acyl-sn-glycerol-3-phosphate acyltransferase [Candidatus Poribacteria bacterium]MBT5712521.1 1-acyl-sn-glycerol-3-phosphate acyltransferase [Candidatus Poribacteria bacterium]MBT7097382.1 1-acyl-sn-glycerol-3-phosphate acyltransferase [Candidatus Poribacteria bacterium]MBT7808347.1 1-acyl-sn-glycerol-3-phosphate acyltransferase [Candidatus Poribacteria bacterium]